MGPVSDNTARPLPDVASDPREGLAGALDWVGMGRIEMPVTLVDGEGHPARAPARVDAFVNLARPEARGIHMSRLYLQLQHAFASEPITPAGLRRILQELVDSQRGLAASARVAVRYDHLLLRPALESGHSGWKSYPVSIEATLAEDHLQLWLQVAVAYSSTCPASAALSRQLNADRFAADFGAARPLSTAVVRDWLASARGMAATPHAQRSTAKVRVELRPAFAELPVTDLVDRVEVALGTPVQTAVKREDEQAFARLNAEHLMFAEDAARRIAAALQDDARVQRFEVDVAHHESLHAHDAVASVRG